MSEPLLFSSSSKSMNMSCSSFYFCLFLLFSFFHYCFSTQNFNHVLCKDIERQALLQFKHSLIDRSNKLASWVGEDKECCSWTGIVCDNATGHVHQIHLPGVDGHCQHIRYYTAEEEYDVTTGIKNNETLKQMLGGDLSPSLLHLKQLRHLDLSCNDFGGIQVPSFIGSFGNLRYLNLSSSRFGGIIPPQLGNLSKLHVLGLGSLYDYDYDSDEYGYTSMLNMQWLSNLRLLQHMDMSGMDLSKAIDWFQVINTLPSLAEIHLSGCQLSDIHPHVPSLNLTTLSLLDLSGNYFYNSFVPRWISSITSLVSLDLSGCNFQGATPSSIDVFRNLTSLELLHVSGNHFMNSVEKRYLVFHWMLYNSPSTMYKLLMHGDQIQPYPHICLIYVSEWQTCVSGWQTCVSGWQKEKDVIYVVLGD